MKEEKKNKVQNKHEEEIKKLQADLDHWKNEYYRAYADMQNLRKNVEKDHREALKYRAEGFIDNLLPVLDGFHLALNAEVKSEEMKNFLVGFQFIYRNLVNVLEQEGVSEVSPKVGDKFDPTVMPALETVYDEGEPNRVLKVNLQGYKLHEHLIRPAIVVVSTDQKDENKDENNDQESKKLDA